MAYAGTPTGLAQQAGTSRPWKTVLAATAVLAIGLALVIAVMFINTRAVAPTTGRDDSVIEAQRDATLLSGKPAAGVPAAPAVIDESYNTGEGLRGIARATGRDAGVPAAPAVIDESYNTGEGLRGIARATGRDAGVPAVPVVDDPSYNTSEGVRGVAPAPDTFDPMWLSHGK